MRRTEDTDWEKLAEEDEFTFWPVNLVLILLGTTILGVAFFYLDPLDSRLTHNPWTYVVVTPIVLMLISTVLSTIVSRIVEKTMQMAFLLSVLVHLFLLIGAMNVVIFSQFWPNVIESFAKERHELRREAQQANQYHRVSSNTQVGARPDHMSFVPTQHQPTEMDLAESPALSLTRSTASNLVSPQPKRERTANAHIIERQQTSAAMTSASENAATLSRSELQRRVETQSAPRAFSPVIENASPETLKASETPAQRTRSAERPRPSSLADLAPAELMPRVSSSSTDLRTRAEPKPSEQFDSRPAPAPQRNLTRSRIAGPRQTQNSPSIEVPEIAPSESNLAANAIPAPSGRASASRSRADSVIAVPQPISPPSLTRPEIAMRPREIERRQFESRVPTPSAGQYANSPSRETAGGRSGPPAPSSMPVQGVESLSANNADSTQMQLAPQAATRRRSPSGRAMASLPSVGLPSAPSWSGNPSLAGGITGTSPAELAATAAQGSAASNDSAGLTGQGRMLQRSRTGLPGAPGEMAGPATVPSLEAMAGGAESDNAMSGSATELSPTEPGVSRSRRPRGFGDSLADGSPLVAGSAIAGMTQPSALGAGLPDGLERASAPASEDAYGNGSEAERRPDDRGLASRGEGRAPAGSAAPAAGQVDVPDLSSLALGDKASGEMSEPSMSDVGGGVRRRRSDSNLLAVDEPLGAGGISPILNRSGDLIERSNAIERPNPQIDLDTQRFARQNVGGPLAAGQISLPTPAFQQRLERLQDRNPLDQTSAEPQTELAIERGLAFLSKNQRRDGSWQLQDFDTEVLMTSDTAATGLSLLAFQGAGYTHQQFKYADVCGKALKFLCEHQLEDGDLYIPQDPASDQNAWLYSHAIAALALCEAYGMTQDPELKEPAQRAIDFMVASQDPQRGGWRYRPGVGTDTSVSGWFMMAFKSGQLAGLKVPRATFERLETYLDASQSQDGAAYLYRYNPFAADTPQQRHGLEPTAVMTSVGLLMRLYSGWQRDMTEMQDGASYLLTHLPEHGTRENSRRDTYYWYYATQFMFHMSGEIWDEWHDTLYPLLIENQVTDGEYEGSWDPISPTPDLWARYGGRLYVTTMNLLSLEVSYRHLPLYEAAAAR